MSYYSHLYNCRNPKSLKYDSIADRLWEGLKGVLMSEGGLQAAIQSRVEYVAKTRDAVDKKLEDLSRKSNNLEKEKDIVIAGFRKGFYTEEELQRQLDAIREDEQRCKMEIESLLADKRLEGDTEAVYQEAKRLIPVMQERLNDNLSDTEKQKLIRLLVKQAFLDKSGNLTIEFKVPAGDAFANYTAPRAEWYGCTPGSDDGGAFSSHLTTDETRYHPAVISGPIK